MEDCIKNVTLTSKFIIMCPLGNLTDRVDFRDPQETMSWTRHVFRCHWQTQLQSHLNVQYQV